MFANLHVYSRDAHRVAIFVLLVQIAFPFGNILRIHMQYNTNPIDKAQVDTLERQHVVIGIYVTCLIMMFVVMLLFQTADSQRLMNILGT